MPIKRLKLRGNVLLGSDSQAQMEVKTSRGQYVFSDSDYSYEHQGATTVADMVLAMLSAGLVESVEYEGRVYTRARSLEKAIFPPKLAPHRHVSQQPEKRRKAKRKKAAK